MVSPIGCITFVLAVDIISNPSFYCNCKSAYLCINCYVFNADGTTHSQTSKVDNIILS